MAETLKCSAALVCSMGCVRKNNEDNFYFNGDVLTLKNINEGAHIVHTFTDSGQLYAVLDGMGGQNTGERASCIAAELLEVCSDELLAGEPLKMLTNYALLATRTIFNDGKSQGIKPGSQGTTFAALCMKNQSAYVANVGDSRVYLMRQGEMKQLSQDHSYVASLVRKGQITELQGRIHPKNHVIDQYLGKDPERVSKDFVYCISQPLFQEDRFMLCSDGLTDLVPEKYIAQVLTQSDTPDEAACKLVMTALELGGKDNTTCIVVDVIDNQLPVSKPKERPFLEFVPVQECEETTGA